MNLGYFKLTDGDNVRIHFRHRYLMCGICLPNMLYFDRYLLFVYERVNSKKNKCYKQKKKSLFKPFKK